MCNYISRLFPAPVRALCAGGLILLLAACTHGDSADAPTSTAPTSTAPETTSPAETSHPSSSAAPPQSALPEGWDDGGIFSAAYEQAYAHLRGMTDEQKVGQLLFARCPDSGVSEAVRTYHLGGLVLFGRDFAGKSRQQVTDELASYQAAADIPLLFATDEEGGSVVRVSSNRQLAAQTFASPQAVFAQGGLDAVTADTESKADLLLSLGIHVNLAPVADVSTDPGDYMYRRSFGASAGQTADYVRAVVDAARSRGLSSTLKHFPGYGRNADTHTGSAVDERPLESFRQSDFLPFAAGIAAGAESVLVSHNIVMCMDKTLPASLSPAVHELLRGELGFTGVILTDDLAMGALASPTSDEHPAVLAVQAGNDMLLVTDYADAYEAVLAAVRSGRIDAHRLDRAVFRVLAWKYAAGLFAPEAARP